MYHDELDGRGIHSHVDIDNELDALQTTTSATDAALTALDLAFDTHAANQANPHAVTAKQARPSYLVVEPTADYTESGSPSGWRKFATGSWTYASVGGLLTTDRLQINFGIRATGGAYSAGIGIYDGTTLKRRFPITGIPSGASATASVVYQPAANLTSCRVYFEVYTASGVNLTLVSVSSEEQYSWIHAEER